MKGDILKKIQAEKFSKQTSVFDTSAQQDLLPFNAKRMHDYVGFVQMSLILMDASAGIKTGTYKVTESGWGGYHETEQKVIREFQNKYGVKVGENGQDGRCGPATFQKIQDWLGGKVPTK